MSRFSGKLVLVLLDDKDHPATRDGRSLWGIDKPLTYRTSIGGDATITVPPGMVTDLASIPRMASAILPPDGPWTKAAIIHDFLYATSGTGVWKRHPSGLSRATPYTRTEADDILREAMADRGVMLHLAHPAQAVVSERRVVNAPAQFRAGSVWSLWDVLTLLDSSLVHAAANLGITADRLARVRQEMTEPVALTDPELRGILAALEPIESISRALGFPASAASAARCREMAERGLGGGAWSANGINALTFACSQTVQAFQDELAAQLVFALPSADAKLLRSAEPLFGTAVDMAFPLAAEDIAESGKCLAFGRYTATVFHLMRAMESAVQALASKVGVAHVEKEWGKLLSDIGAAIEKMPKGPDRDRWSQSHSHLYHVKQAWRNDTMHPKNTYTEEETLAVFAAVKSFMAHLAPLVEASS